MSSEIQASFSAVFTLFIVLIIGLIARKIKILDDIFSKKLSDLIIVICQPFMIIAAMMKIPFSKDNLKTGLLILAVGISVQLLSAFIAYFSSRPIKDFEKSKIAEFSEIFSNTGFIGFPILSAILGDIGLFWGAFYVVTFNMIEWTYGITVLGRKRPDIRPTFKKIVVNYGTIPCMIGFVFFLLRAGTFVQTSVGSCIYSAFNYLGSLCTPVSLLLIGATLAKIPFKKWFTDITVLYVCIIRLIVLPVVVAFICRLVHLDESLTIFSVIMAGLPTAANSVMIAEKFNLNSDFTAHIVAATTLFSAVTIPLVIFLTKLIMAI